MSRLLPRLSGYDAAVGYLEGTSTYFVLDNVDAKQKLSFLHTDYDRIASQKDLDERYYARLDMLFGVSDVCTRKAELLQIRIPETAAAGTLRQVCGFLQQKYSEDSL